jgi:four helix bundle protein
MDKWELSEQLKAFALRVMKLVNQPPRSVAASVVGRQLMNSATSAASNYRASLRSRSTREFAAKPGVVLEELDESAFWLEFIRDGELMAANLMKDLIKEADELCAIIFSSRRTVRAK